MPQMWTALVEAEDFWNGFFDIERSGDFVPAGSSEELERLRSQALHLVMNSLAEFARDAASRAEFDLCQRVLKTIRTSSFPAEILSAAEESVLGLYEDALVRTSKEITKRCWEDIRQDRASAELNAKPCSVAVDRWKQELESKYSNLVAMSGTRTKFGLRARQHYADFLISLGNALTWADQWMEAEKVLRQARSCLPGDSPARERIEALLSRIGGAAERERIEAIFSRIGSAAAEERESERKRRKQNDIEGFETGAETAGNASSDKRMAEGTGSIPARIAEPEPESSPSGNAFVELCHSITLQCWQQIKPGHFDANLLVFRAAHADYKRRAAPWLAAVLESLDRGSTRVVRHAAAKCLNSLAGGFISVGDLGTARTIALEALQLIADIDRDLESEVRRQLDYIASEMKQSAPKRGATHRSDNQAPRPVAPNKEEPVTLRTPSVATWLGLLGLGVVLAALLLAVLTQAPSTMNISDMGTIALAPQTPKTINLSEIGSQAVPLHSPVDKPVRTQLDPVEEAPTDDADSRREPTPTALLPDPVSLPNGTNLIPPPDGESAGTFTLENSSSSDDSVVILKDAVSNKYLFAVYIGAKSTFTVPKIPSGKYVLEWAYGRDWDATHRSFRRARRFGKSPDPFVFPDDRIRDYTVTLHTVAGNKRMEAISAEEFANDLGAAVVINNKR